MNILLDVDKKQTILTSVLRAQTGLTGIEDNFPNVQWIFFHTNVRTHRHTPNMAIQQAVRPNAISLDGINMLLTLMIIPALTRRWWICFFFHFVIAHYEWHTVVPPLLLPFPCCRIDSFNSTLLLFLHRKKWKELNENKAKWNNKKYYLNFALWWSVVVHLSTGTHCTQLC